MNYYHSSCKYKVTIYQEEKNIYEIEDKNFNDFSFGSYNFQLLMDSFTFSIYIKQKSSEHEVYKSLKTVKVAWFVIQWIMNYKKGR